MNKRSCQLFCLFLFAVPVLAFAGETGTKMAQDYLKRYPFFELKDTVYTAESEFKLPEGFTFVNDSKLSNFSAWIAHFPLWHRTKQVGSWEGGKAIDYDKVSRVVHLPWKGQVYNDAGFMVRVLFDYWFAKGKETDAMYKPANGDACTYPQYLKSKMIFNNRGAVAWQPSEERAPSPQEYYKFMYNCQLNTTYAGLILNADPVKPEEVKPGDMFIAHDESGQKGAVYLVMDMIENKSGQKQYAVATGCQSACDFHIPLLTADRDMPWVTTEKIQSLAPAGTTVSGFYRFKVK